MKRRILGLLMALVMMLSLVPTAVFAEDDHEHVPGDWTIDWQSYDEESHTYLGHCRNCTICGAKIDKVPHIYNENYVCTVCGYFNVAHPHELGAYECDCQRDEVSGAMVCVGHYPACRLCKVRMGDTVEHSYVNDCCTECGFINPDHEHLFDGRWMQEFDHTRGPGQEPLCLGHYQVCEICNDKMGEMMEHDYVDGVCEQCGWVDPDYNGDPTPEGFTVSGIVYMGETSIDIPDGGMVYYAFTPEEDGLYIFTSVCGNDTWGDLYDAEYNIMAYDDDAGDGNNFCIVKNLNGGETYYIGVRFYSNESGTITLSVGTHVHNDLCWQQEDAGHFQACSTCGEKMSETEPHAYNGTCCTVCGGVDPNHEHALVRYNQVWQWIDEMEDTVDVGHAAYCEICGERLSGVESHNYQNSRCTVCDAVDPNHEHVPGHYEQAWQWDGEKRESFDVGHAAYCKICGARIGDAEPHTYDGDYCTVCGGVNPGHECIEEDDWSYGEGYGHYKLCTICKCLVGDEYDHTYENGRCTVCGAVNPDHECVAGDYRIYWVWDDALERDVDKGHSRRCRICDRYMGNVEDHTFDGNYCTVCGAVNPDHECVLGDYRYCTTWDRELEKDVDLGHARCCEICGRWMGAIEEHGSIEWRAIWRLDEETGEEIGLGHAEVCGICNLILGEIVPHTYDGNYCTVCGEPNPDHECVAGDYQVYWEWDDTLERDVDKGHSRRCRICDRYMGDVEDHTYDGNYCAVCGAVNPDHECVCDDGWNWDEYVHYASCNICGERMGEDEPHTFENNFCTICRAIDPNHECVPGEWISLWTVDEETGKEVSLEHVLICNICGGYMSDIENHTCKDGRCTVCGEIDPNHECVSGGWKTYYIWDEENGPIDVGHMQYCSICNNWIGEEYEPHTFENNYCTVCGAIDPDHECVPGEWASYWEWHAEAEGYSNIGHKQRCSICRRWMGDAEEHTFDHGMCTVCGGFASDHTHDYCYTAFIEEHRLSCSICGLIEKEERHTYDADGVCTVCGAIRDMNKATELSIRIGGNNELILTPTFADGTSYDMTVLGFNRLSTWNERGWTEEEGTVFTDRGSVQVGFWFGENGAFYVVCYGNTNFSDLTLRSNTLDRCEWCNVYCALCQENIVSPSYAFDGNVWVVDGKAYDGEPVHMTLDGDGNVLTYEVGTSGGDVEATLPGDVNNDGKVNQKDVARLRQYIGDSTTYPLDAAQNADVNCDGKINQKDVARLRQYIGDPATYPLG